MSGESGERVGVAVVGAGLMGRMHAKSIRATRRGRLLAIHAADEDQARALATEHGVRCIGSFDEVLEDPAIHAISLPTPTDTHAPLAIAAIRAGKHVFVEKPIARTWEQAVAIVEAAAAHDRVLAVGHVIRYFPDYQELARQIHAGAIGTPAVATFGRRCQKPDWAPDGWHTTGARSGGVMLDMMIHDVDLVRWYFGEPTSVYGRTLGPDTDDGLDYGLATLTVPGGPICHLHGSWAEPAGFSQSAEIAGSAGLLSYDTRDTIEFDVLRHAGAADVTALPDRPAGPDDPFTRQLDDWLGEIQGAGTLISDGPWALRSLQIALAMIESSDIGRSVSVALQTAGAA